MAGLGFFIEEKLRVTRDAAIIRGKTPDIFVLTCTLQAGICIGALIAVLLATCARFDLCVVKIGHRTSYAHFIGVKTDLVLRVLTLLTSLAIFAGDAFRRTPCTLILPLVKVARSGTHHTLACFIHSRIAVTLTTSP